MATSNPFLQSPFQTLIAQQEEVKPLPGSDPVKDTALPDLSADPAPAPVGTPAPRANPSPASLLPPENLRPLFEATAAHFKVPVNVLMAMTQQESSYNPDATNKETGAAGMAQYIDATAKSLGINARDPNEAVPAAAMQLRERLDKGYSMQDAVAEHFAGSDRKKWGEKTAAYGAEVLAKAGAIGKELYGDAGDSDASTDAGKAASPAAPDLGPEQNKFAPTRMRRADYEKEFRALNPRASQPAVDNAMAQYDQQVQEAGAARAKARTVGPKPIPTAEQFFDQRLNARLQGDASGVVPQLPANQQPVSFPETGTQHVPSTFDTVAGNLTGGALHTLVGAVAGSARLLGADDVADEWEAGKNQIQARQKELGGDSFKGKVAGLIGGILPAMSNASESMVLQFATNSGLFGVPAFQDTYKEKLAEGQSKKLAAIHAFEAFGLNTVGPMIMPRGVGALVGKLGGAEATGVKAAALGMGQAAGEGVAFSGISTAMDKGTDVLAGHQNDRPWLDPEDMAVQAAGFGAMRAGHMAPHAIDAAMDKVAPGYQVGRALQEDAGNLHFDPATASGIAADRLSPGNHDPATIAPQETSRAPDDVGPSPMTRMAPAPGPLTAAVESAVESAAKGRIEPTMGEEPAPPDAGSPAPAGQSVVDQLRAIRPLEPAGPLEAAIQDAAEQHAVNPAPMPEMPQEAPQPPALETLPLDDLRAQLKQVAAAAKADPSQALELRKQRQAIEKEIGARAKQAKADSKPAEEALASGPFDDIKAANAMMLRYAEQTGQPHEVVGSEGKFEVKPIGESNGINPAGAARGPDGHGRSGQPLDGMGRADGKAGGEAGRGAGGSERAAGNRTVAGELPDAGADRAAADGAADAQQALTEAPYWKKNPYHAYAFPDAARADAFMDKKNVDREQFEAVQTGPVRWQVKPRAIEVTKPKEANRSGITSKYIEDDFPIDTAARAWTMSTVDAVQEAVDLVGESELQRLVDERPASVIGNLSPELEHAMSVEKVARKVVDFHDQKKGAAADVPQSKEVPEEAPVARGAESAPKASPAPAGRTAKPRTSLIDAQAKHEKQAAAVRQAEENAAKRKAAKAEAEATVSQAARSADQEAQDIPSEQPQPAAETSPAPTHDLQEQPERAGQAENSRSADKVQAEQAAPAKPKRKKAAPEVADQKAVPAEDAAPALSIGKTPNSAEPITVKDGVVHIGKYAAADYDTGNDVTVPKGATPQQVKDALIKAGAMGKGTRIFGTEKAEDEGVRYSVSDHPMADEAARTVDPLVQALADKGAIVLHKDASTLPVRGKIPRGVQALTTRDGTIHVVANALGDNGAGIVLHEAFHAGAESLVGTKAWGDLQTRLGGLYRQGEKSGGAARAFWDAARARVEAAKAKGAVARGMEIEEFGAYAIEEYAKAPASIRKWVDDLVGHVKAWVLSRFGQQLGDVTPAQLTAIAKLALLDVQAARSADQRMEPAYSADRRAEDRGSDRRIHTVQVDGERRPIENSRGQQIGADMHQQMAFWRWAKNTAVMDEQGRPRVMYHGTTADFSEFDAEGLGAHFTADSKLASDFAAWKPEGGNVMPVYLAIRNPLRIKDHGGNHADARSVAESLVEQSVLPKNYVDDAFFERLMADDAFGNSEKYEQNNAKELTRIRKMIEAKGYDGLVYDNTAEGGGDAWVPFSQSQIKSVIGNSGEFGNTPDIRYSVAGAPTTPTVDQTMRERLARTIARPVAGLRSAAHDAAMLVVPMEAGSEKARAMAKEFANNTRAATAQWTAFDTVLRKNYSEQDLTAMWHAADQENDLRREGRTSTTEGLASLSKDQRDTVELLHAYGEQLWERAKRAGLVADDSEGVHYWTPRVAANIYADGSVDSIRPQAGEFSKDAKNLRTSASSTKQRKHETTAESEAALKAKLGEDAEYVKNIRVMPMAMAQLEKAVAGRTLVNQIKAQGQVAGQELISETGGPNFVTFDHPALRRYIPKTDWHEVEQSVLAARGYEVRADGVYRNDEKLVSYRVKADGSVQQLKPMLDSEGNPVLLPAPLFVHKDFAGPLRAVFKSSLGNESVDKAYRGLMELKGASMSMIMISPMTHNAVIWGKAMPSLISSMGWKNNLKNMATLGGYTYVMGHQFRKDHALVNELIQGGLVPIGGRGMNPDVQAVAEGIKPGRSMLARALGAILDQVSPKAGDAARKGVDAVGHFWHETLLWDRIGDMQVGMAVQMRNHFMDMGIDQYSATRIAAHFANRYAGAIPQEAMSQGAHALLNMTLFSKSFTMTNLGAMKDPFVGLPSDLRAQIKQHAAAMNRALGMTDIQAEDAAGKVLAQAQSATRKKAAVILMADFGAMAVITSLTQAYFKSQSGDDFLKDLKERLHALGAKLDAENPLAFLGPTWSKAGLPAAFLRHPFDNLGMLSQTHDNPHGKEDRIRIGEDEHGNTYYMRLPVGKVVEEMKSYTNMSSLTQLVSNKASPLAKGATEAWNNKDFQGRNVFDKNANIFTQTAQIAGHMLKAQMPFDDIVALKNVITADKDKGDKVNMLGGKWTMDEAKLLGTATGLSVSKLSGGDAVAEMRYLDRERADALHNVLPDVRDAMRRGDEATAEKLLEEAGQDDKEIQRTLKSLDDPGKISRGRMKRFQNHATDEQMDRLDKMMK